MLDLSKQQSREKKSLSKLKQQIDDKIEYISWMVGQRKNCFDIDNKEFNEIATQTAYQQYYKQYQSQQQKSNIIGIKSIGCSTTEIKTNQYFPLQKPTLSFTDNFEISIESFERIPAQSGKKQFLTERTNCHEQNLKLEQNQSNIQTIPDKKQFNKFTNGFTKAVEVKKRKKYQKENDNSIIKQKNQRISNISKDRSKNNIQRCNQEDPKLEDRNKDKKKIIQHKKSDIDFQNPRFNSEFQLNSRPSFYTQKYMSQDQRTRSMKTLSIGYNFSSSRKKITPFKSTQKKTNENEKIKPQRKIVSLNVKQRMKELILQSACNPRKQHFNSIVRINLLKRLDQKYKACNNQI